MANPLNLRVVLVHWYHANVGRFPQDVHVTLVEPNGEHELDYAAMEISSPSWLALAEVWGNGAAEVMVASASSVASDFDPRVDIYALVDEADLPPILDRLYQVFEEETAHE